jgi:hypothetical protein
MTGVARCEYASPYASLLVGGTEITRSLVICGEAYNLHFTTRSPVGMRSVSRCWARTLLTMRGAGHGLGGIATLDARKQRLRRTHVLEATKRLTLAWLGRRSARTMARCHEAVLRLRVKQPRLGMPYKAALS